MEILLAAVLTGGCLAVLGWLPNSSWTLDRQQQIRRAVAFLLILLPLGFGALVLFTARERTRVLRFDYVGKRLAFGTTTPVTAGSSPGDSLEIEDLQAPLLGARSVLLEPAKPGTAKTGTPATSSSPSGAVLELSSPSPAVRIDDRYCNSYPLEDGDTIVIGGHKSGAPVRISYDGNHLSWSSKEENLPSALGQFLSGSRRVYELAVLDKRLAGVHSFLHRPDRFGPWHLLIRSQEVRIERAGTAVGAFVEQWPVPAMFDLSLEVVYVGGSLRSQRRDRILVRNDEVEVRFLQPRRWVRAVPPGSSELPLALGVPSAFAREEMIELPEPSSRFRGLTALYRYDRSKDRATITFLADEQEVRFGDIYALGAGKDRLLLLLDRRDFPHQILLDLALLNLFLAVFLFRGMASHSGLASIVGPVGLLLAHRLLFSHKAANQPPDFTLDAFEESRLALWLVPALLVFAWALAWLLRQPARPADGARQPPSPAGRLGALGWPLAGLVIAAAGTFIVSSGGTGGRRALALLPLLLGAILALAHVLARRPRVASALGRIQRDGFPWRPGWIVFVGAAVLVLRWIALALGMPETLRLPFSDFRLLWTVLQLPVCAAAVGLTLESLRRLETAQTAGSPEGSEPPGGWRLLRRLPPWLAGIVAFYIFLVVAFLVVAVVVGDTGLVLVHVLAPVVSLLVLASAPPVRGRRLAPRIAVCALASLPLLAVIGVNAFPGALVQIVGWGAKTTGSEGAPAAPVREQITQLSSTRAQQMFRLYMLANPKILSEVGLDPAERVAIQFSTLQSYARRGGWLGRGYLGEELPRHLGITYLSDLVPMVFVLTEFGRLGLFGLALLYLLSLAAVPLTARVQDDRDRLGQQGLFIGFAALLAFVLPSLYMLLANLNLVLFTGKNMNLLSLNSLSDVLESGTLLGLAILGLGLRRSTA
ncbi:MAG TPA: hypothetical protein VKM72_06235 [Thermoanaerobaculia bacterium]|nr:hypothetical protein [Thermoanaerobaculia bacterium]